MCCSGRFIQMMVAMIKNNMAEVQGYACDLITFFGRNAGRSHTKRDTKKGRSVMALRPKEST
jgi:hypothetical protein